VVVDKEDLRRKLAARDPMAQIKGVYDLLVTREQQAAYSALGKGKHPAVPNNIRLAMIGDHPLIPAITFQVDLTFLFVFFSFFFLFFFLFFLVFRSLYSENEERSQQHYSRSHQ